MGHKYCDIQLTYSAVLPGKELPTYPAPVIDPVFQLDVWKALKVFGNAVCGELFSLLITWSFRITTYLSILPSCSNAHVAMLQSTDLVLMQIRYLSPMLPYSGILMIS